MVVGDDNLNEYERLLILAEKEGLTVYENYNLNGNLKGLYCDDNIALSYNLETASSKACILAEEIGHYYTATDKLLDLSNANKSKQEKKGRAWAIEHLVPREAIASALACGCTKYWEIAEHLGMECKFIYEAMIYYRYIDM